MLLLIILIPILSFLSIMLLGRKIGHNGSKIIAIAYHIFLNVIALLLYVKVVFFRETIVANFGIWMGGINFNLIADPLSVSMIALISFISLLVIIYSTDYMDGDPHLSRFLAYLVFFSFAMLLMVSSMNIVLFFFGWESVG
jgi:NADH:ubiquinone oxidoreductase subunit 5 (subunit L)/multisubunit Na+/H+ antiporter MnhA subunit